MKARAKFITLLIILVALLVLTGCEKDGDLRIINRTSYPVYAGVSGEQYTIPSDSDLKLHISTKRAMLFDSSVGRYLEVFLEGETYQIWDEYEEEYVNKTEVWINAGKTTNIYVDPNRACVKVINQSQQYIKRILVQKNTISTTQTSTYDFDPPLAPEGVWFEQQPPSNNTTQYYYIVQVVFENDTILSYGNVNNILYNDQQFLVTVEPEE